MTGQAMVGMFQLFTDAVERLNTNRASCDEFCS